MKNSKEYEQTQLMIEAVKKSATKKIRKILKEEKNQEDEKEGAIAITNSPRFGTNVLQNQIDNFRKTVNGGAKFGNENESDPESNPLVYYPKSGNLVFSGSIPNLSGLKFQFSLNDVTNAPYIFVDGLALTEDVITTLNKISGFYKNWRDEFEAATDLLDKLKKDYQRK